MKIGLLLLTGGQGNRMGTPKHNLMHPAGGTWGNHLVSVFRAAFPNGPVQVLGEALVDRPDLPVLDDPRQGPGVALKRWAAAPAPVVDLWWVVACDQVRWCEADLRSWVSLAQEIDPKHLHWVIAKFGGHVQPLGGLLPHQLRLPLTKAEAHSLMALVAGLPHHVLSNDLPGWRDVDTSADRALFEGEPSE